VTQPSNLVLSVKSNGDPLSAGSCAYIDPTPQMPQISAQVRDGSGNTVSGTITWQIFILFNFKSRTAIPGGGGYYRIPIQLIAKSDTGDPQQLSADQTWNASFSAIRGGTAELKWTYNGVAQPIFRFRICGQNPSFSALDSALGAGAVNQYWFLRNIAIHETNESQFCQQTRSQAAYCAKPEKWGDPVFGIPAGYGSTQLDPVDTIDQLWDWRANASGAVARTDAGGAYAFWRSQVQQWRAANVVLTNRALPKIPSPQDQQETATCNFTAALDASDNTSQANLNGRPNTYWFGDAIAMKGFARGARYLRFKLGRWSFDKVTTIPINGASQNHNYVYEFCTCSVASSPPSSTCAHQTP
jgi:hypothetical protein